MSTTAVSTHPSVSLPFFSERNTCFRPSSLRFQPSLKPNGCASGIKVMAGGRESLDHLQRSAKPQPRQRNPQLGSAGFWERFPTPRTVQQMMDTMEKMMDDPWEEQGNTYPSTIPAENVGGYRKGRTPWEIQETETDYKVRFDMPGMTKKDVKVWVSNKMLIFKAEKAPKKTGENGGEEEEVGEWPAQSFGRYSSRIALPENVVYDDIKAQVKDGVLYITIPKASASARTLDINVE